jgi:DNA-binding MarR family transcriptional regulator
VVKATDGRPDREELGLPEQLNLVIARLARQMRQQAMPGLSPTQVVTLFTLEPASMTLGALASAERVQPSTMTVIIDRLEAQGLVRRCSDRSDRRVVRVALTAAGRRVLSKRRAHSNVILGQRLETLTATQRATLAKAVEVLNTLVAHGDTNDPPRAVEGAGKASARRPHVEAESRAES